MNPQQTSILTQLGYLGPSPQTNTLNKHVGFSGSPSGIASAQTGFNVATEPIIFPVNVPQMTTYEFPVSETSLTSHSISASPLESLVQTNALPTYTTSGSSDIRSDEIMDTLLKNGFVVENRVYNVSQPSYLIARTRLGDRVFLRIDNPQYRTTFPMLQVNPSQSDIQMERKSSIVLVPQETKMGILQCLNYDVCGAAFVCNGSVCITQRQNGGQTTFKEENYVYRGGNNAFTAGQIGRSLIAYPIVDLSEALTKPEETETKVAAASNEIVKVAFKRLQVYNQDLSEALIKLNQQSENMSKLINEAETQFNSDIDKLSSSYNQIKDISPDTLADELQSDYYTIARGLAQKKELRTEFINSLANAYNASGMVRSISNDLRTNVDPVLIKFRESANSV